MRRGTSRPDETGAPRFCPNCGAANSAQGLRCTICGQQFSSEATVASYWDKPGGRTAEEQSIIDLYTDESDRYSVPDEAAEAPTRSFAPVMDPWSAAGGRLGGGPGDAFVPPGMPPSRREGGPPGFVLGCAGLLLILVVAVAAALLVARPFLAERVEDSAGDAIERALAQATLAPDVSAGTVIVSEREINRSLAANVDDYDPVEDIRVQIRRTGIETTFSIYGFDGTLTGTVAVDNGRIVIRNPEIEGAAGRVVDVDNIAGDAEAAINDLLTRNNLRATAATLSDDTLTITTEPLE